MSKSIASFRVVAAAALVLASAGVAGAAPQLKYEIHKPDPAKKKELGPAPSLVVTVINAPGGTDPASFTLRQTDSQLPAIKAVKVTPYLQGTEALGVVVLIEGDANYLATPGLAEALQNALGKIAQAGPPGSQGAVLLYGAGVDVRQPMGPLEKLGEAKLAPKDPAGPKAQRALFAGVKQALAELDKVKTPRKALIVIGDGIEGDGGIAPSAAARDFGKQLADKGAVVSAIVLQIDKPPFGAPQPLPIDPETGENLPVAKEIEDAYNSAASHWKRIREQALSDMKSLTNNNAQKVTAARGIDPQAEAFVGAINDRYYVTFPGYDPRTRAGLRWDGKVHPVMLRIDGQEIAAVEVKLAPAWSPGGGGSSWWIWLLLGGGALAVGGVVLAVAKRPKPIPMPPPVVAPPPQQPQVRQKTIFQSMDGDAVFPMVGWVVFMNGPKWHKWLRVKQGVTKIGTGTNSDVVIDDGYMSTDHALILQTPEGFWIQDNNSTNGTFLNDNKLTKKEELFDNDLILVGKTVLKFKAVM